MTPWLGHCVGKSIATGSVEGRGDLLGWGAAAIRGLFGDG